MLTVYGDRVAKVSRSSQLVHLDVEMYLSCALLGISATAESACANFARLWSGGDTV